jgi:hypothetical protein
MTRHLTAVAALAALLFPAGCGFTPNVPDSSQMAAAEKAGKTYETFSQAVVDGYDEWAKRPEGGQHVKAAIVAWERAYAIDPYDRRVLQLLAISYYYDANYFTPDKKESAARHLRGYEFGVLAAKCNPKVAAAVDGPEALPLEKAVEKYATPGDVPGLYWMVVNLARAKEDENVVVRAGIAPQLKICMETIYRLGPRYYWGGVHRFFGAYYTKAPGQSNPGADSKREFELAVARGPENLENKVLMAEYWATFVQDRDSFERILKEVVATDPKSDIAPLKLDNAEARKRATRLLAEIDERF